MAIPLLEGCNIAGKDITGDALLTQRTLANYIVERQGHYHFTAKANQPTLQSDIGVLFERRGVADFVEAALAEHGRIETRRIWCSTALNTYLDFPHAGQVFLIERESIEKKTGKLRRETALGVTSRTPHEASPQRILAINRGHWSIESVHYIIDWNPRHEVADCSCSVRGTCYSASKAHRHMQGEQSPCLKLPETYLRTFNRNPNREERVNLPATGGEGQGLGRYGQYM